LINIEILFYQHRNGSQPFIYSTSLRVVLQALALVYLQLG